jgi:hypothetical protein
VAITIELIAKLNAALLLDSYQLFQRSSSLRKRLLTVVFAVEMKLEDDAVRLPPHGGAECIEVRSAVAVLDNGLTINDCRLAAEVGGGTDDRGIAVAPIVSVASEDSRLPSLNQHLAAIAVVFDFVNPMLALRRLFDRRGKLRLDEPEAGGYAKHWGFVGGPTGNG